MGVSVYAHSKRRIDPFGFCSSLFAVFIDELELQSLDPNPDDHIVICIKVEPDGSS